MLNVQHFQHARQSELQDHQRQRSNADCSFLLCSNQYVDKVSKHSRPTSRPSTSNVSQERTGALFILTRIQSVVSLQKRHTRDLSILNIVSARKPDCSVNRNYCCRELDFCLRSFVRSMCCLNMCKIVEKENFDSINTFLPFQTTRSDVPVNKRNRETERKRIWHVLVCGKKTNESEREKIASPKIREQNVFVSTSFSSFFPSFFLLFYCKRSYSICLTERASIVIKICLPSYIN